ncbi:tRNA lysidine(34) synthetase [Anaerostipes sp.]|uniref:tRNA lysidine(34) synthetase n=1 Tax=Anaerostipes sp. TaxID=1872530 RepID=UPI00258BB6CA|nr:ATP-binding protein [Anaerostipes sp.]MCI5623418.1 tRNA 2-thiocytidine(32) synthetase TtcA [Anaerostipes sp.]MDY2726136.1 ATP-binding protein [Anaerostipes faecalis]
MKLQQVLSRVRKAVDDYGMIQEGDKIAVGISGGKDSLTLLYALAHLRIFYPNKFDIHAITVDLGFGNFDLDKIKDLCRKLNVEYTVVSTEIADIVFKCRKETNPCSLCAKMRKGALNEKIKELGCNKVAYGHHKNDMVETVLMSMIFESRIHCFSPVTYLDRMDLTVIRPLMYMDEEDIIGFQHKMELPVAKSPCPMDGYTKREYAKDLVKQLDRDHPGAKDHMFKAIIDGNLQGWPEKNPPRIRTKSKREE